MCSEEIGLTSERVILCWRT